MQLESAGQWGLMPLPRALYLLTQVVSADAVSSGFGVVTSFREDEGWRTQGFYRPCGPPRRKWRMRQMLGTFSLAIPQYCSQHSRCCRDIIQQK